MREREREGKNAKREREGARNRLEILKFAFGYNCLIINSHQVYKKIEGIKGEIFIILSL